MEPLKNLLDAKAVRKIASAVARGNASFDTRGFLRNLDLEIGPLELKQRVLFITSRLRNTLPNDVRKSFPLLLNALKQGAHDEIGISGFLVWPLTRFVSEHGLGHFELSMKSFHAMTQVFTAEFDIRPFLQHHEERTLHQLAQWTDDPSAHVRRLVSEGTRPLLPWGERLPRFMQDPDRTWALLDALRADESEYVRKSVANHLNDHSKHHGDWVVKRLKGWRTSQGASEANLEWIIRHATRTLVKRGHTGALKLHGIGVSSVTMVRAEILTPKIKLGGTLDVEVTLRNPSNKSAIAIIDHEVQLLKSNGTHSPKVFKGKKLVLDGGQTITVAMKIPIRPVTVRTYYSGIQYWIPLVNGTRYPAHEFALTVPKK